MESDDVERILQEAGSAADRGAVPDAWDLARPLLDAADADVTAARGAARLLHLPTLERERRLDLAGLLFARWSADLGVVTTLGGATEALVDVRYLNAAPPSEPLFGHLVRLLVEQFDTLAGAAGRARVAWALATAARIAGRRWDDACARAHAFLVAEQPGNWHHHYNQGLFFKTRGHFAEGVAANREAAHTGGRDEEDVTWNLGICATGCGDGETALAQWRAIGCTVELDDGLPAGRFSDVQVRLAQHPVAERDAGHDDPGDEETIWVERLSPCHGRVVSALHQDLGVDYGDLVLFDGAPIRTRTWGGRSVPVFPHLATLRRSGWSIFRFAATQAQDGEVGALGGRIGDGATLYVHTERLRYVCHACWEREGQGHSHEDRPRRVVTGKLVVPPAVPLATVAAALVREEAASSHPRVYVPDLWSALGDHARAAVDRRRHDMLVAARETAR